MPQVTEEFLPGTYPLTLPTDATNIVADLLGSGADGSPGNASMCGGGGGGGWFTRKDISSLAGQTVQVIVPAGGGGPTLINPGGNIEAQAPGGLETGPGPNPTQGYSIVNAGGRGGYDSGGRAGTGGMPGSESVGGVIGIDGGGEERLPGANATVDGGGGDGGGIDSPGGLGGPGFARVTYDMPDPVDPPPPPPPPEILTFAALAGGGLVACGGSELTVEEYEALAARLNALSLER